MYLGIDIGTTATKAILIDASQSIVASRSINYPTSQPAPGLAEQDPDAWIHAVSAALRQLYGDAPAAYAAVGRIGPHAPDLPDSLVVEQPADSDRRRVGNDVHRPRERAVQEGDVVLPGAVSGKSFRVRRGHRLAVASREHDQAQQDGGAPHAASIHQPRAVRPMTETTGRTFPVGAPGSSLELRAHSTKEDL